MITVNRHRDGQSREHRGSGWHGQAARCLIAIAAAAVIPAALAAAPAGASRAAAGSGFQPAAISFWSARAGVVFGAAACGQAGGCRARLMATADGGRHWHLLRAPAVRVGGLQPMAAGVLFASARVGWVYGSAGMWYTSDGGARWRRLRLGGAVSSMATSAGIAYAVVVRRPGPGALFTSPARRAAWARVGHLTGDSIAALGTAAWFSSADHLWVTTGGKRWHRHASRCPQAYSVRGLAGVAPSTRSDVLFLCVGDGFAGGSAKAVLDSADGGKTVHLAGPAPSEGQAEGFAAPPGRPMVITLAASGGADWLYTSRDGGKTWTTWTAPAAGTPWTSLVYSGPATAWVVLGGPVGSALLRTTDTGRTWHKITF
jgi:hypothetical protein